MDKDNVSFLRDSLISSGIYRDCVKREVFLVSVEKLELLELQVCQATDPIHSSTRAPTTTTTTTAKDLWVSASQLLCQL